MPHKLYIYIAIPNDGDDIQPGYISTQGFKASIPQGHKPIYTTSYLSIPNGGDDPAWLYINKGFSASMPHKETSLAIQQAVYLSQMMGTIWPA